MGEGGLLPQPRIPPHGGGGLGGGFDGAGRGGLEAGGEAEELVDAARVFADDADESAVGGGDGNLL